MATDEPDVGADVVPLFPPAGEDPVRTRPEDGRRYCSHTQTELDKDARRVYCRACGREVDPFGALLGLAQDFERYVHRRDELQREVRRLGARVEDLKREERNAKARARRRAHA